jgi:hypothetical protein
VTHQLLTQLIDATPPPPAGLEVDDLLAAFEAIIARRAAILDQLAPPLALGEADRALVAEIERRDAAWQAALTAALELVGGQRHGSDQLRAYGPRL